MKSKKAFVILFIAAAAFLGVCTWLYAILSTKYQPEQLATKSSQASDSAAESNLAPDFTVYDADGNAVRLSDFIGKPIVLNFWASWCGPCKSEMPEFNEVYLETKEDVVFLMVNMTDGQRETVKTAKEYLSGHDYAFPVFYDMDSDAANTYEVFALPTTYLIDADGSLVAKASGAINSETLRTGIAKLRSE